MFSQKFGYVEKKVFDAIGLLILLSATVLVNVKSDCQKIYLDRFFFSPTADLSHTHRNQKRKLKMIV